VPASIAALISARRCSRMPGVRLASSSILPTAEISTSSLGEVGPDAWVFSMPDAVSGRLMGDRGLAELRPRTSMLDLPPWVVGDASGHRTRSEKTASGRIVTENDRSKQSGLRGERAKALSGMLLGRKIHPLA